jgi:hypothetical protein
MKLTLRVLEAAGLCHLNHQDNIYPYCLVQLSNSSQIQRTKVMERTTHPVWDQEFSFTVHSKKDSLKIFVKNCSRVHSHVVVSTVAIGLQHFEEGTTVDQWFGLSPVRGVRSGGQIHLMLHIESSPARRIKLRKCECASLPVLENRVDEVIISPVPLIDSVLPRPKENDPNQSSDVKLLMKSGDFGDVIDTHNPNDVNVTETSFSQVRESPAKMYSADAMAMLQLELGMPVFGLHWALAKVAAFSAHQACDYFTDFAVAGCEGATQTWVLNMKKFFNESNHDINRNRILGTRDTTIGPLMSAVLRAYDVGVAAMARKETLFDARGALNDALGAINAIRKDPAHADDYTKAETALLKGCQSYTEREDGAFFRNLHGAHLESLGLNAAVCALGISSLEHTINCYICNSFGSRIVMENQVNAARKMVLRTSLSSESMPKLAEAKVF